MKLNFKRQVDTRITVIVVVVVLALVQAAWWKGLVFKPKPPGAAMGGGGGGGKPAEELLVGRKDVTVFTFAGAQEPGSADGIGRNARFDGPVGMAVDGQGNIILADSRNNRIRRISPSGHVDTLAGSDSGYADGPAGSAKFSLPSGVDVLPDGTVLVADSGNNRIRAIKSGVVSTVAGGDAGNQDGIGSAARFNTPMAVGHVKGSSDILVADALNKKLRKIGAGGMVSSTATLIGTPTDITDVGGAMITLADKGSVMHNGATKAVTAGESKFPLRKPLAVCASKSGFYIVSEDHRALFEVSGGSAEVVAGRAEKSEPLPGFQDGTGDRATFGIIAGIAFDGKNHIYVADISNNAIRRITLPE